MHGVGVVFITMVEMVVMQGEIQKKILVYVLGMRMTIN